MPEENSPIEIHVIVRFVAYIPQNFSIGEPIHMIIVRYQKDISALTSFFKFAVGYHIPQESSPIL